MTDAAPDQLAALPIWAWTGAAVAELFGVTRRRVSQLAEEGRLRRCGRSLFDITHGNLVQFGAASLGQDGARGVAGDALAAVGWLRSVAAGRMAVNAEEMANWRRLCARWGLTDFDSAALIASAASLLGDRCPKFESGLGRKQEKIA